MMSLAPSPLAMPITDVPLESVLTHGYLTVKQVAERTGMRPESVRHLIYTDRLNAIRPYPKMLLIAIEELERYEREKGPQGRPRGPRKTKKRKHKI